MVKFSNDQLPLSVADYMAVCLYGSGGYYMAQNPLGAKGDFTTAPEISQMFGEVLGAWVIGEWQKMGQPERFTLLECGPGRGVLMADVLRTLAKLAPVCRQAAQVTMLEISPRLASVQQEKLVEEDNVYWAQSLDEVELDGPVITLANEFLDAFPIRQYEKKEGVFYERLIEEKEGVLAWCLADDSTAIEHDTEDGEIIEVSTALDWLTEFRQRINIGTALFIDYGYTAGHGETLQAIYRKEKVSPLLYSGEADLTAHVDFSACKNVLGKDQCEVVEMGPFLTAHGLAARAGQLMDQNPDDKDSIEAAAYRLLSPDQMGTLFKVLVYGKAE